MAQDGDRKPVTIVVNDDPTQLKVLVGLLTRGGLQVIAFDTAEAALEALNGDLRPDLIVTDLYMPGIDGWRFCRLLRSPVYERFNNTPILVVSATFSGEEPDRISAALGANAFLSQPVEPGLLLDTVNALLRNETAPRRAPVLIVEDDRDMAELLRNTFERYGYHAEIARSGREAMEKRGPAILTEDPLSGLDTAYYEIVVLDYHLPDTTGEKLLPKVRERWPGCAIVITTGDTDPKVAVRCMKEGAAAYVRKPFDPGYLVELCAHARRERALLRTEERLEEKTAELRESEAFNAALFDYNPIETIVVDREGQILKWNKAKTESDGRLPSVGERMYVDYAGRHAAYVHSALMECIRTGETAEFHEERYGDKVLSIKIAPFPAGNPHGAVITSQDITQQRSIEAQLRHSQKLESIGTLAGGVAHEINNPINGIMNYAQLILDRLGPDSPVAEFATEIDGESRRVASIVRNLLSFASPSKEEQSPARIRDIVDSSLALIQSVLRHDQIELVVDVPEDLPLIRCRSQQIQQVLMNLLTNARDALNEKYPEFDENKRVRISACPEPWPQDSGSEAPTSGDHRLRLTVEDSGPGISKKAHKHLFDPFYTSKRPGKGTGLGLSISHTIIKEHGGELSVESKVGQWTRFHVDLPANGE